MSFLRRAAAVVTSLPGRIVVTVGLLTIVALSIEWDLLVERLQGAAWGWFALGVGLIMLGLAIGAVRWQFLLNGAELYPRLRESVRAYAIGAFSNNLLPTSFGGDAVRAWIVARRGAPLARALTSVAADRVSAFYCLIPLGWIGVAVGGDEIPGELVALFAAATAVAALGGVVAVVILRRRGLGRILPERLRPWAAEVARTLRGYGHNRGLQVRVTVLGLAFQGCMVAAFWSLSEALGLGLDPGLLAVVLPLVLMAMLMPISIAGFGVREGAFVALLAEAGTPASDAVLLSLLTVAAISIASLPGGVAMLLRQERPDVSPESLEAA
jgi:glycosyltransferase 2 family protein